MSRYRVSMEIAGPFAMWARPDTGAMPTSYPVPTWSAAKGVFESVAFFRDGRAWICPTKVEICKPKGSQGGNVRFQRYTNNYRGPLRNKSKPNFQFSSLILSDVCYRLYASVENGSGERPKPGDNPCHALQAIFNRRLKSGQCHKTPALGWNEFVPSYWGEPRETTEIDTAVTLDMVSILSQVFDKAVAGGYGPCFKRGGDALVENGVFHYAK